MVHMIASFVHTFRTRSIEKRLCILENNLSFNVLKAIPAIKLVRMHLNVLSIFPKSSPLILRPYFFDNIKFFSTFRSVRAYENMSNGEIDKALRKMKREKASKYQKSSPSQVFLQVLGSGVPGSPSSLYVSSDHIKYMFNCGEGTQRLAHEHHARLSRLEHALFTTATWKNMGGLPGMALTVQDAGVGNLSLHGPKGIGSIFEAVKKFVLLNGLTVSEAKCEEDLLYEDSCMSVSYVHLKNSTLDADTLDNKKVEILIDDSTDYYAHEVKFNKNVNVNKSVASRTDAKPIMIFSDKIKDCVTYICKLTEKRGFLQLEKCVEMNVPPGPLLGRLKNGQDVTLEDGSVVKSADVCSPPIPGPVFIVVECPSEEYLDSLINHEKFKKCQIDGEYEGDMSCIVHFSPENILTNARYVDWMKKFPPHVDHLVINGNYKCQSYEAIHKLQHQLYLVHPTIFSTLHDDNASEEEILRVVDADKQIFGDLKVHRMNTLHSYNLRPRNGLDRTTEVTKNRTDDVNEIMQMDGVLDVLAELQTDINAKSKAISNLPAYPKIVMLGTGSCIPNKGRNVSAILLRVDEDTSILMDCGEGTSGQMYRFFGPESNHIFSTIKAIYVSHLHADHHLGLIGALQNIRKFTNEPIYLIAPKEIEWWLQIYHKKFEPIANCFKLITNQTLLPARKLGEHQSTELHNRLNIGNVSTCQVIHCPHSFGVCWTLKNGRKIVYSGDTKPSYNLITLGKQCDLLIHEATMEDGLEDEANKKAHSTVSQAIQVGRDMEAKFIFLTHFSQRYAKITKLPETQDLSNVAIAFDNMQFNMAEVSLLPLFYPFLKFIFSESMNELELRSQKRMKRSEIAFQDSLERYRSQSLANNE